MENNILPISIEKFAAFLDGNLAAEEMQGVAALISENDEMQMIVDTNSLIDDTLSTYSANESELPFELQSLDFALPDLDFELSAMATISPEKEIEDIIVAAAYENVSGAHLENDTNDIDMDTDALTNRVDFMEIGNETSSSNSYMDDL